MTQDAITKQLDQINKQLTAIKATAEAINELVEASHALIKTTAIYTAEMTGRKGKQSSKIERRPLL